MADKKNKAITPKQTMRQIQEQKKTRTLTISFGITLLFILGLAGYGFIRQNFLVKNIPVAKVADVEIDNRYFQDRTRLERNAYIQQFQILNAQYQLFADDPAGVNFYKDQLLQYQMLLDSKEIFGNLVLDKIIEDQVIALEAEELGIEVTEEEIEEGLQVLFSYYPKGTPTPRPTPTFFATPTYSKTQQAILEEAQPTPELASTPESTSESGGEEGSLATPESETSSVEPTSTISATIQNDATPTATLPPASTPTPYSQELYEEKYLDYIGDLDAINIKEENLRKYMYFFLLRQKVREEVIKEVTDTELQIWARHILVKTKSETIIVLSRLENGENWVDIAADVSLDTSNKNSGGDLGWFPRGQMVPEFENAAFDLDVGDISEPVETDFGWHLIQLVGKEERPLSEQSFANAQEIYFEEWVKNAKEKYSIEINEVWRELVPTEPSIPIANRIAQ